MKDFYEYLNDIPVRDDEIEEIAATELEKKALKKRLKSKVSRPRRRGLAAAIICAAIGSTAAVGVANPAFAAGIPIIGDIFRFIDSSGSYELFQSSSEHMGYTAEDSGIKITLEDALFDGKNIFYTYSLETDESWGDDVFTSSDCSIKGYYGGIGGSEKIKKISDGHYAGISALTIDEYMESADIKLTFDTIYYDAADSVEQSNGKWQFKFRLQATEGNVEKLDLSSEKEGVCIDMVSITTNPMAFTLDYTVTLPEDLESVIDEVNRPGIMISVKDDLGNSYEEIGGAGFGNSHMEITESKTFGNLDPNASQLIITPVVVVPTGGGGVAIDDDGNETPLEFTMPEEIKALDGLELDSIIIEL